MRCSWRTKTNDNFAVGTPGRRQLNQVIKVDTIGDKAISVTSSCHNTPRTGHLSGTLPRTTEPPSHLEKCPRNPSGGTSYKITGQCSASVQVGSQGHTEDSHRPGEATRCEHWMQSPSLDWIPGQKTEMRGKTDIRSEDSTSSVLISRLE